MVLSLMAQAISTLIHWYLVNDCGVKRLYSRLFAGIQMCRRTTMATTAYGNVLHMRGANTLLEGRIISGGGGTSTCTCSGIYSDSRRVTTDANGRRGRSFYYCHLSGRTSVGAQSRGHQIPFRLVVQIAGQTFATNLPTETLQPLTHLV